MNYLCQSSHLSMSLVCFMTTMKATGVVFSHWVKLVWVHVRYGRFAGELSTKWYAPLIIVSYMEGILIDGCRHAQPVERLKSSYQLFCNRMMARHKQRVREVCSECPPQCVCFGYSLLSIEERLRYFNCVPANLFNLLLMLLVCLGISGSEGFCSQDSRRSTTTTGWPIFSWR